MLMRFLLLGRLALVFLDLHPGAEGEFLQGFLEVDPLALHDELEDVAAFIACAETAPRPRFGPDHKGGRMLVIVERTKTGHVPTGFAQFDPRLGNEVDDVYLGFDLIDGGHKVNEL